MTLDENALSEALHAIEADVSPDLASRVRVGGRRRLVRRRSLAAAGAVAVGAAAVPVSLTIGNDSDAAQVTPGASPPAAYLYAAPPVANSECNTGNGDHADPTAHADLLLLPPAGQDVRYAYIRDETFNCANPHIALIAVQEHGDSIGAGVVVAGPNAPTATEDGRQGPDVTFGGDTGELPIHGQPAVEFTLSQIDHTDAFWTEPDGGQWHATVRGLPQAESVALLNRIAVDGRAGTATLAGAAKDEWTIEPPIRDAAPDESGVVYSQWLDAQGHAVDMTVTQTPERLYQHAIENGGPVTLLTVRGHPAVLFGGRETTLIWQEARDVQVSMTLHYNYASVQEAEQAAESLSLAEPNDPRINRD